MIFDLNWNEIICSRFENDNLQIINPYFLIAKNQITDKQKTYIKNFFISIIFRIRNDNLSILKIN